MEEKAQSTSRRIGSNLLWTFFSVANEKVILFIATIYLARVLGVESFGILTAAQILTMSFWLAVDLGVNRYGVREIAKHNNNPLDIINQLMGMRIVGGIVVFLVLYVFLYFSNISPTQKLAMYGCGAYLITHAPYADWVFRGLEKFKFITYGSFVSSIFFLITCLLFIKSGDDIVYATVFWSSSYFLSSVTLLVVLKRIGFSVRPEINLKKWLMHLRESIYFVLSGGSMVLLGLLPILILTRYLSSYALGIFSAPYRIVRSISGVGMLVQTSFYPVLANSYHNDRREFLNVHEKFRKMMLILGIPVSVVGIIFANPIISLLLGSEYADSAIIFQILMVVVAIRFFRFAYGATMTATGFQRAQVVATVISLASLPVFFVLLAGDDFSLAMTESIILAEAVLLVTLVLCAKRTYLKPIPT